MPAADPAVIPLFLRTLIGAVHLVRGGLAVREGVVGHLRTYHRRAGLRHGLLGLLAAVRTGRYEQLLDSVICYSNCSTLDALAAATAATLAGCCSCGLLNKRKSSQGWDLIT